MTDGCAALPDHERHPDALALTRHIREATDELAAAKLLIDYADEWNGKGWELGWNDGLNMK
jgi:hypothetical protein